MSHRTGWCREFEEIVNTGELTVSAKTDPESGFLILKTIDLVPNSTVEELFRLTYEVETRGNWRQGLLLVFTVSVQLSGRKRSNSQARSTRESNRLCRAR